MEIENFIRTYDALPHDFCNRVVNLFEANIDKASPGKTLTGIEDHKVSLDIEISQAEHIDLWRDIDKEFHKSVGDIVGQYMNEFAECFAKTTQMIGDVGYAVRKYQQGTGFFGLHSDVNGLKSNHRMLAVIWYLNTVSEGGETKFPYQKISIKPEIGKAVIFPTNWTHLHSGEKAISHPKYIVRTFITYQGI